MLYISRIVFDANSSDPTKYGVVDTDDDVENFLTWQQINELSTILNMKIKGVEIDESELFDPIVSSISPYQDKRYYSGKQAKTNALLGVDIRTWRDEITAVVVNTKVFHSDSYIRLSEYGKRISGVADIYSIGDGPVDGSLTLILDKSIEVYGNSLSILNSGIKWDITELDVDFVSRIYSYFRGHNVGQFSLRNHIIGL